MRSQVEDHELLHPYWIRYAFAGAASIRAFEDCLRLVLDINAPESNFKQFYIQGFSIILMDTLNAPGGDNPKKY